MALGLAPSAPAPDVSQLTSTERVDTMVSWFFENFEDPAHGTPYDREEGGYVYIWGGPYDAREQIVDAFAGEVAGEEIEAAAKRVEADGFLWAPNGNRIHHEEDQDREPPPPPAGYQYLTGADGAYLLGADGAYLLGVSHEREPQARARVSASLDELRLVLEEYKRERPNLGHNNPPEPIEDIAEAAEQAASEVREQLANPKPDQTVLQRACAIFSRLSVTARAALGGAFGAFVTHVGDKVVDGISSSIWEKLQPALAEVAAALAAWISSLF